MLKIYTTVVPPTARAAPGANNRREQMAHAVLQRASDDGVGLVVFPAGLLRARDEGDLEMSANRLLRTASDLGVAVVFGIDTESAYAKRPGNRIVRQCLPFFIVAQSENAGPYLWRQRSSTSGNGYDVPIASLLRRTLRVGRVDVDVLACGEVFNAPLRECLAPWSGRIVVVPSHTAQGARFFQAVKWSRAAGVHAMLRATHAWSSTTSVGSRTKAIESIDGTYVRRWE